jgi:hypothetical protein
MVKKGGDRELNPVSAIRLAKTAHADAAPHLQKQYGAARSRTWRLLSLLQSEYVLTAALHPHIDRLLSVLTIIEKSFAVNRAISQSTSQKAYSLCRSGHALAAPR